MNSEQHYKNLTAPVKEPKNSLEYRFERAMDRALLSPMVAAHDLKNMANFVDWYEMPIYRLGVGIIVIFLDASVYNMDYGSFYPFWTVQAGYISKKSTNIKLQLLTRLQADRIVELANKILEGFQGTANEKNVVMRRDDCNFEWRVPLSESEILKMNPVFQELVRRTK